MVSIHDLYFSYGQHEVLKGLSLDLQPGRIHGVLGKNGAGKTTLFNICYRRLPPEKGRCTFAGQVLGPRHVAFLETQNYFYPYLKGREYLELLSLNTDFDIAEWNKLFELPLEQLIDAYSTGMKKKLAFLGIMALDRPVVLLDEPFNGVDVESNEKIFQILDRLRQQGKTIILSSHILQSLTAVADTIHLLDNGRIEKQYAPDQFSILEKEIREMVGLQIQQQLDKLF